LHGVLRHLIFKSVIGRPNLDLNQTVSPHPRFDFTEFLPNLCPHFDKLFRPQAVPVVSLRDPRSAFRGPRSGRQAAVQSATSFAFNWWFLARGAPASFCEAISFHDEFFLIL